MTYSIRTLTAVMALTLLPVSTPVAAQDISFNERLTKECYSQSDISEASPTRASCIGRSAKACMDTSGAEDHARNELCLQAEYDLWDQMSSGAYFMLEARLEEIDSNSHEGTPSQVILLENMHRAWINLRNTRCTFMQTRWRTGPDARSYEIACLTRETANQFFFLEDEMARGA